MDANENTFEIEFLDHVAIRVANIEASVKWYQEVLGLQKYELPDWKPYPIVMLANKTGIALFPATTSDPKFDQNSLNVKIDHFAFQISIENFQRARKKYQELNLKYTFEDHHYFHSLYTNDPDGHTVELTTLMVDENSFYKGSRNDK